MNMGNGNRVVLSLFFFFFGFVSLNALDRETAQLLDWLSREIITAMEEERYSEVLSMAKKLEENGIDERMLFSHPAPYSKDELSAQEHFLNILLKQAWIYYSIYKNEAQASESYEIFFRHASSFPYEALLDYGHVLWNLDRRTEAVHVLEAGKEKTLRSDRPYICFNLGWYYYLSGEYERSVECSEESFEIDDHFPGPLFNGALSCFALGEDRKGIGWFGLGMDAYCWDYDDDEQDHSWILPAVIDDLNIFLKENPESRGANLALGLACLLSEDKDRAEEYILKAGSGNDLPQYLFSYITYPYPSDIFMDTVISCEAILGNREEVRNLIAYSIFQSKRLYEFEKHSRTAIDFWISMVRDNEYVRSIVPAEELALLSAEWVDLIHSGFGYLTYSWEEEKGEGKKHTSEEWNNAYQAALGVFTEAGFYAKYLHADTMQDFSYLYENRDFELFLKNQREACAIFGDLPVQGESRLYRERVDVIADNYFKHERYDDALDIYEHLAALAAEQPPYGRSRSADYDALLVRIGDIYSLQNKDPEALRAYEQAIDVWKEMEKYGNSLPNISYSIVNKTAVIHTNRGHFGKALNYFELLLDLTRKQIGEDFPVSSEESKTRILADVRYRFDNIWRFAELAGDSDPRASRLGYNALLAFKSVLLDSSRKVRERILHSDDEELRSDFIQWLTLKEKIGRFLSGDDSALGEQPFEEILEEEEKLEADLSRRSELYRSGYEKKLYEWSDVVNRLPPNSAAIEIIRYEWGDDIRYAAYIVDINTRSVQLVVFPEGSSMESTWLSLYRAFVSPYKTGLAELEAEGYDAGEDLFTVFWKPVEEKLGDVRRVYLSPDGVFNLINLGTIPKKNTHIIDTVDIQLVTSTRNLIESAENDVTAGDEITRPVLVGYPDYSLSREKHSELTEQLQTEGERIAAVFGNMHQETIPFRGGVEPLFGTKEEVETIADLFLRSNRKVTVLIGEEALEEKVKQLVNPKILHIATHGFFSEDGGWFLDSSRAVKLEPGHLVVAEEQSEITGHPLLQSGLLLAGCEKSVFQSCEENSDGPILDDGILTSYEAMNCNFDRTELVVLSACETGLGKVLNGEGVYGLQRAFQVAGARAVIMSLWKVDDEATKEFMIEFYRNYLECGEGRAAYLDTVREMRKRYDDPFYWGAFVYTE